MMMMRNREIIVTRGTIGTNTVIQIDNVCV